MPSSDKLSLQLQELEQLSTMAGDLSRRLARESEDHALVIAMATVLHGFYGGAERIFRQIAATLDGGLPGGEHWHKALLASMSEPGRRRPPVISTGLHDQLRRYLTFRHAFLNTFPHRIQWERLKPLADELAPTIERTVAELGRFIQEFTGRLD